MPPLPGRDLGILHSSLYRQESAQRELRELNRVGTVPESGSSVLIQLLRPVTLDRQFLCDLSLDAALIRRSYKRGQKTYRKERSMQKAGVARFC